MSRNDESHQTSVLKMAWQRYAEFDTNAQSASQIHLRLRGSVIVVGVVATLLAVLADMYGEVGPPGTAIVGQVLKIGLIGAPIVGSAVLAFANKFQQGERWLALRTGAEEIRKDIYLYRTILQVEEDRHHWLSERLAAVQGRILEIIGGDLALKPYTGPIPHQYDPKVETSDPGFSDLLAEDYLQYRLQDQLDWHQNRIAGLQRQRTWLQVGFFIFSGLGTILAALASRPGFSGLSIWVAFTTALATALTAWMELRRLDSTLNNYNRLVFELTAIRDHWQILNPSERTGEAFFKLITTTEKVLWSQHNRYISEMRKAVAELKGEPVDILEEVEKMPVPAAIDEALVKQIEVSSIPVEATPPEEEGETAPAPVDLMDKMQSKTKLPHAFVVMPFGQKQGPDGRWIDFDSIYQRLIKPALQQAGFEPFRADEETVSGDILTDMFQELLLADLVVADLSIDNANAFYELGVRHAMRKRGVVHIQSGRAYLPFDIFNVRTIPYHTGPNGKPDPKHLDQDIQTIAKVAYDTWVSDQDRIHSPIFNLLDGLAEPDRKKLRTPLATAYWREYKQWQDRVEIAQRQDQIGDVLLLTEEVRNPLIREEAILGAGQILRDLEHHALALKQYQQGLEINPRNIEFRQEEAFQLGRLKRHDEAIVKLERLLEENPADSEAIAFLGRLYKDMWQETWQDIENDQARLQAAYEAAHLLKRAIEMHLTGFSLDQSHYYSGINALTLGLVLDHLAQQAGPSENPDPEIETIRRQLPMLAGAVEFSLEQAVKKDANDFWAHASLGDIAITTAEDPRAVAWAYRKALALSGKSMYAIQSILAQLQLLDSLAFRSEYVKAGIIVLEDAFSRTYEIDLVESGQSDDRPAQVFLCSGHMIDHPNRAEPRFPPAMEAEASQRIEQALDKLKARSEDMVITAGAACGGDILFIEACLRRNMTVEVYLPFPEARFIEESVSFAGDSWVERFYEIRRHPRVTFHLQPDRVGPVPQGDNPFARNNRWALYSTLCYGIDRVRLIVLWNGQGGDGIGGTAHMVEEVRQLGGLVEHLDTTRFDYWQQQMGERVTSRSSTSGGNET